MAKIPRPDDAITEAINAHHERVGREGPRPYLGFSELGHHCDRWLWLRFRWAVAEKFSGRQLRLFRRGHAEEASVVADLRAIGCVIHSTGDEQEPLWAGGHVGSGGCDGIIESGVPGAEKTRHILEIKTYKESRFKELLKDGIEVSNPTHWSQMQACMRVHKINRALYVAVCKDTDEMLCERVRLDKTRADRDIERGKYISESDVILQPTPGASPTWYKCKMCSAHSLCHKGDIARNVNCRTCAMSTAEPDGTWYCTLHDSTLSVEEQLAACPDHAIHPDLVPLQADALLSGRHVVAYFIGHGETIYNGHPDSGVMGSHEFIAYIVKAKGLDE